MNHTGFAVVISNITIPANLLPFKIEARLKITEAGGFESRQFDDMLKRAGYFSSFLLPFGATPVHTVTEHGERTDWVPPTETNMYVVEFSQFNQHLPDFQLAGLLIRPKFRFGMESIYRDDSLRNSISLGGVLSYHQLEIMKEGNRKPVVEYDSSDLESLSHYYSKITTALVEGGRVRRALSLYADTDSLPERSGLLTLSYFSILESLVTNGRDTADSITNQLKNKIRLLLNRAGLIDHKKHFNQIEFSSLWKKLYSLRSDIAHGNSYVFTRDYQALIDLVSVNSYLDEVVASIIRLAIDEPGLVEDLREC